MTHHDLVVIGGGPAGYASALYAAASGLNVGLVERNKLGGTCLNVGCIPAKELLETAAVMRAVQHAADFGVSAGEPTVDFSVSLQRKEEIVNRLVTGLTALLKKRKITVYNGNGSLSGTGTVLVDGGESSPVELSADNIVLATGSTPRSLPGFDIDGELVMSSDELLSNEVIPKRCAVVGGGAIGCEFASMLSDLGTEVTIIEYLDNLVAGADKDCSKLLERSFKKRGISINTGVSVTGHTPLEDGGTRVSFGDDKSVDVDLIAMCVGRAPVTEGLGLDKTDCVVDDRGFIEVDENFATAQANVYAIGDVINTPALAHIGFAEGMRVIKVILGEPAPAIDYDRVPWCIYSHPEVAFSGLTEEQAKEAGYDVVVDKHRYMANGRAMIIGNTEGMVKVIAEAKADGTGGKVLGVHMVGPWVTEQLGQGYLAVNWEATVEELAALIQPHPTLSETFGESVLALTGRGLH